RTESHHSTHRVRYEIHSFPTRRSSDLSDDGDVVKDGAVVEQSLHEHFSRVAQRLTHTLDDATEDGFVWRVDLRLRPEGSRGPLRSEEHTSELQSRSDLVCRLLPGKKNS